MLGYLYFHSMILFVHFKNTEGIWGLAEERKQGNRLYPPYRDSGYG